MSIYERFIRVSCVDPFVNISKIYTYFDAIFHTTSLFCSAPLPRIWDSWFLLTVCVCVCPKTKIAFGMKPKRASHFTHPSCLLYAVCRDNFQYTLRTLTFKQSSSLMYLNAITFGMHSMLLIVRFSWKIYIRIFFCSLIY